jgi:spermidine/putrescine transport system substrate-binding protein
VTKKTKRPSESELTQLAAKTFTRRTVLKSAAAAGAIASVAPYVIGSEARAASGELNIMMWSDYLPAPFKDKFEKESGVTIKHTPYGSNEELINKIKATRGRGFDLISPTNDRTGQWQDLDLLQTFDMNRVPTDKVIDSMLKISAGFSWDGKPRHLPYVWGTEALAWRTDKWSRDYADLSYGDLWADDMKGKVMGRPHSLMAGIGLYLDRAGILPSNRMLDAYKDEENMRRIWSEITKFAVEHKPWLKQFWNDADGQINGFMQNDVVLGQTWDGPPLKLKADGKPVTFMAPQEGAFTWLDGLSIPVGAKNLDAVYEFIKFSYDPANAGLLANETGYNATVKGADQHLTEASKKNFQEAYPGDALDKLWPWPPTPSWYAEIRAEYRDKFVAA